MGVSANYLGHVEIVPTLNQAEYDYLHAFARSAGATEVTKESSAEPTLCCRGSRTTRVSTTGRGWRASDRGGPACTPRRLNSNRCHCLS